MTIHPLTSSLTAILLTAILAAANFAVEGATIVKDGKPTAQIVIAEKTPRMVPFAAKDLQTYVKKMSGAELPIVTKPKGGVPVNIYVGESEFTKKLGVTEEGLKNGAFRMQSGTNYLILLGHDEDFTPKQPGAMSGNDIGRAQKDWEKVSGGKWINPRKYHKSFNKDLGIWFQDEGGSLNAVCGFLRKLGVRWYMPGELGEVVPKMKTIPLPEGLNVTDRPDYSVRVWLGSGYTQGDVDSLMWERRIGINSRHEALGESGMTHGMHRVHGHKEMQEAHPEYYALYGTKRDVFTRGTGHACFSSPGLEDEAVHYVQAVFDHFDEPILQLSPQDGLRQCQCPLCLGKSPSDYVFGFLNNVAKRVEKTHPNRLILGAAYTFYRNPPESIDRFSPNVAMSVNNVGRPGFVNPEMWKWYTNLMEKWREKLGSDRIIRVENNLYNKRGKRDDRLQWPSIHPRCMAKDLKAMKGLVRGERNEIPRGKKRSILKPGVSHPTLYANARYLWDADRDVDEFLDEYYEKFYGPAAKEMKEAFDFAESKGTKAELKDRITFVEKLHEAKKKAGDDVYGERVQLIIDEIVPLDVMKAELKKKIAMGDPRKNNPTVVAKEAKKTDDRPHRLVNLKTGDKADVETDFDVRWDDGELVFDILCHEPDMKNLFVSQDVWGGDSVAILLESPEGAYYQMEINPDGKIFDASREFGKVQTKWDCQAKVETERGDDFWRVVVRIPILSAQENQGDPFHYVVGPKPSEKNPWYFNVGRVRVRGELKKTPYSFQPTGRGYHKPMKFAKLVVE